MNGRGFGGSLCILMMRKGGRTKFDCEGRGDEFWERRVGVGKREDGFDG